ncbi:probable methyltransferase At1g29790 isoform X2 [Cornus florida]|uniref:probable methyltransferase At1g29790 isoform X2 n=1 Tax=Cornus florida TaxID=4283 RepID=UPI00289A6E8B|nr:probable methyltransferase At1g29790 isoform X2 [Cornus florida]
MQIMLIHCFSAMRKTNVLTKLQTWRGKRRFIFILCTLALLVCMATLSNFYSVRTFLISDAFCKHGNLVSRGGTDIDVIRLTVETVIQKIQQEISDMRDLRVNSSSSELRYNRFLADILGLVGSVQASLVERTQQQDGEIRAMQHPLSRPQNSSNEPGEYFLIEEIRKYVRIKPNRLGKQNFMGANGTFTSIGHACFAMKKELEEYMDYDIGEICKDDWKLAQKLMVHGCDPLPRRRCFSRAPQLYSKPLPINESMWKLPDNRNVRWSQYRCKNFTCLATQSTRKGFFKCSDCFNLTHHEMPRWIKPAYQDPNSNLSSDFVIPEVLHLKPGEMRIGLDFSVGTGSFAARMREYNVTVVSATINLGAPFSEMIALRGLVPLYLTINQRLPFFDNTLDLIHTTRFLDGWIDFVLLDFVLFDWDRVLRPGGLLWIDSFFCAKADLDDYLEAFKMLRYKKHKWVIVPKLDKDDGEVFFSAVLEKPPRPFR